VLHDGRRLAVGLIYPSMSAAATLTCGAVTRRLVLPAALAAALVSASTAAARSFVITGRGWGHGIGLSQYGAEGFALHGWSYRRILRHYYPSTTLARLPQREVRVLVAEGRRRVMISSRRAFRLRDAAGRQWVLPPRRVVLRPARSSLRIRGRRIRLRLPVTASPGANAVVLDSSGYRGTLTVLPTADGLSVVNRVRLELYLRGVVPREMPHRWHPDALAAQAVAARSYALSLLRDGSTYDLHDDTRDQVYGGIRAEQPSTNRAVTRTSGLVVIWDGRPVRAYYSSTSGGRTQAVPGVPYLRSVADPYDAISPHHRWGPVTLTSRRLGRLLGVPAPTGLRVVRNGSGRVSEVLARWSGGSRWISAAAFQARLDLRSTWFWVGSAGAPSRQRSLPHHPRHGGRLRGWIVVVGSSPENAGRSAVRALAHRAHGRVLRSSDYPALRPGFLVVAVGPYATRNAAVTATRRLRGRFPAAYVRRL
jgi:stage II sporulation protein D